MEENRNEILLGMQKDIEELKDVIKSGKEECHIFYEQSKDVSDIDKGLVEFHKKIEAIDKSGNNTFLKYTYATLDDILAEVNPKLADEGLYLMQFPINVGKDEVAIRTSIRSTNGQYITSDSVAFKYKTDIQFLGSIITYLKRYAISAALSINLSTDSDCAEQNDNTTQASSPATERTSARSGRRSAR